MDYAGAAFFIFYNIYFPITPASYKVKCTLETGSIPPNAYIFILQVLIELFSFFFNPT